MTRMPHHPVRARRPLSLLWTVAACLGAVAAGAANAEPGSNGQADRRAIYERDRAACESGRSTQERSLCLQDVTVAYRMPHTGKPYDLDPRTYLRNQELRCSPLKGDELEACLARMRGAGMKDGSVQTGGIYRELTTIEVGPVAGDTKPAAQAGDKP